MIRKTLAVALIALCFFAFFMVLFFMMTGVAIGAAQAWIVHRPFAEGWHAVFHHKWQAVGWSLVFCGGCGTAALRRSR